MKGFESHQSFSHVDVGDAFQFINHISHRGEKYNRSEWCRGNHISAVCLQPAPTSTCEKEKGLAGCEPTTYGFERQRLTPTTRRPVGACILSAIYDL